jgi:myo-inositol-1(or 4)-monophosphatase
VKNPPMRWEKEMLVARDAARKAGKGIKALLGRVLEVRKKGTNDLVTDADFQAEKAILDTIRRHFPQDSILTEESGRHEASPERVWIVDPLDGTTNFAHALPFYAVCIAFQAAGRSVLGLVLDPERDECFEARESEGAFLNGTPIRVSRTATLMESLVATGFPYSVHEGAGSIVRRLQQILVQAQGIRRLGSAALDLCYVAAGRFEAYWEEGLKPWDTAAAAVIVKEAGGRLTDYEGNPYSPGLSTVVASNGLVHEAILEALRLHEPGKQ